MMLGVNIVNKVFEIHLHTYMDIVLNSSRIRDISIIQIVKKCGFKPDWCVECDFFLTHEPKNRSYKEHVEMYLQRLNAIPAKQ